jgi:hypothetical protein
MNKAPTDPALLAARLNQPGPSDEPPWDPPVCGEIDMRIARDGTWYYHGSAIGRKRLVRLFSGVLRREDDGAYYLVTPVEKCLIEVDDAPFVAVEVMVSGRDREQSLTFRTNLDDRVTADAGHPLRVGGDAEGGGPRPYVLVRGRLEALVARSVYYELVDLGVEERVGEDHLFGVWSGGTFFPLGRLED